MIVETLDRNGPLCPREMSAINDPAHQATRRVLDAFYMKAEVNDEGEFADPKVEEAYRAASYPNGRTGMYLYREGPYITANPPSDVQAWYFQCPVCGFVLPATARDIR